MQLARQQPAAAEALLREGLRIRARLPDVVPSRRRTFLEDDWSIGATKSLLGAALVALRRYDEAETVLLDAARSRSTRPAVAFLLLFRFSRQEVDRFIHRKRTSPCQGTLSRSS